jgi:hypothetical protein
MRHLNVVKEGNDFGEDEYQQNIESVRTGSKKKKQPAAITNDKPRELSMEEKRNVRSEMFNFLESSSIEEMRLEIELERAEQSEDFELAKELKEASYVLQKRNCQEVRDMVTAYHPSTHGKIWGNDPEYLKMLKSLRDHAENTTSTRDPGGGGSRSGSRSSKGHK